MRSSEDTPNLNHVFRATSHNVVRPIASTSCCHAVLHRSRVLHFYLHVLGIFLCRLSRSIVGPQSYGRLSFLLGIWLILQCFDSGNLSALPALIARCALRPSLMCASFAMCDQAVLAFKPLCALNTVELSKTREILLCFAALVLLEMLR